MCICCIEFRHRDVKRLKNTTSEAIVKRTKETDVAANPDETGARKDGLKALRLDIEGSNKTCKWLMPLSWKMERHQVGKL